jgi:hypothetical protein
METPARMEHRDIRYAIRIGIEKDQWRVAIYPRGRRLPEERTVFGAREDAESTARYMINAWFKKRRPSSFVSSLAAARRPGS